MARAHQALKLLIWDDYNKTQLEDDLSGRWNMLSFSTALHGGFRDLRMIVPMGLEKAWLWLNRENLPGRHFHHIEVSEDKRVVWEGRVTGVELRLERDFTGLDIIAMGYWSSMRDQLYDPADAGNTDWTISGPHNSGKVIREMITKECPDINGTADVTLTSDNVVGIDLTARSYPQDVIVDKLAPLGDQGTAVYFFAVWESRKPYYTARSVSQVDWYLWLRDVERLSLRQDGMHLRNSILPVVGTAEGTSTLDGESTADYPLRELMILLPSGITATVANNARDVALSERKFPRQDQTFSVSGRVYSTKLAGVDEQAADAVSGAMAERPKWWVRAGQTIRIQDLVPASAATPKLDDLRTFYIVETVYDASTDRLLVVPDRPLGRLGVLLSRLGQLERDR